MPRNNHLPASPAVILVRPQMGENIGAVARAMSNFGLHELRLAAPRDGWPNIKAVEMAAGAESIIHAAKVFPDFAAAMHDIQLAYATTARQRDMEKRVVTPDVAMPEIRAQTASLRVALVFGPERSGLENEEITRCDTLISISTAAENRSLNLAQSAVILGYEWFRQQGAAPLQRDLPEIAPKEDWAGLFSQLEDYLDKADYFRVPHKKPIMWQNLQNMLMRSALSAQELRTLRGMLRSLWERSR
jgi:tRNA/rRNA methyltransferase